ncbi:phage tail spike protein [Lacticaseibacillus paracasei]|uniref:phage tail spike protein n=2 Tax=Lacticaseibacillus paracasei TaxID=1597 RepID=UPI000ADE95CF|nr:phage tail spike protein [Lacticaseibacillus paracasei]
MADFYFTDRKYNQLGIASTDELASSSVIAIDDIGGQEGDYQSVEGGYRSYSATLHFSPDQSAQVKEMAKVGNFVLFKGRAGESVWTTILSSEHDPLAGTNTFVAEDASIDLINGTVGAYAASSAMTIAQYIELFAGDSGFVIGYNEIPDLTRTLKWDSDDSSILTRILSVATQFGVELSFRFEVRGLSVIGKYIDIRKHIGGNKGIYLRVDTDLNKVVTTSDIADLCTAIAGTGGTPEGSNDPITLKGYRWTDPNGRYVLGGDGVLRDPVALRTWSRLLSNANTNPVDAHITRNKTYEATTQATLLQSVLSDLEKFNHPAVNYEVDIAKLPDTVNIGDTVYLVDEDEQLFLSARVLELTYSYSNESGTATLGDYLIQASQVSAEYRALAEALAKQNKGQDGKDGIGIQSSNVTYQAGSSGVSAPTGTWSDAVPNVAANQYLWSRTIITMTDGSTSTTYSVGKMGANGADGIGLKSSAVTYQIGTSGTTAPSGTWSSTIPPASQGTYLWSRTVTLYTDGTQNMSYSVAYQGTNGSKGPQGDQGLPGAKGADGRTAYAHFAYANSQDGKTDFSTTDPNRKYIGFYSDFTSGDSTNPIDYSWSLIKGADGADGKDGVPGKAGADGKTPYFHIAYADSSDGKTNFSLDTPGSRKYIGSYTDFTQADSTNPAVYSWQLVQGPKGDTGKDGVAGKDGVGIKSTQIMYAQSTSGTTAPTTGWTAQVPTLIKGQYLWTQTTWLYTDNTGESGYTVSYNAKDGNTGANGIAGKDGVGIKSTVIEYSVSSNGVTKPTTGWSATIPSIAPGQFMWTRTTWLYTDGTNEVGYSVAQAGATGPKGDTGVGIPGPKGADGKTSYFHTAYANSIDGKQGFSTTDGNGKSYFGQYVDQTQADSTDPTKYSWALFKGPQGPPGVPGSKDVPYTYIQLGTPASPKKGDLWWHGTTLNDATALQYYNGSTWIDQSIQQAILNIEKLVAIEIDSAIIDSPDINAPFHHTALSDANLGKFSSGNTNMQYGHVNITGNVENDQGIADGHTMISDLGPSGFISRERTPDNAGDVQYANLQGGKLNLLTLISDENAATKKYVFSSFKSTDNVTYYWNNTTAYSNADIDWAYIHYARRNNICTVSFDVVAKGKQGWLDLVQPRAGYKPYLPQATGATLFSTSYIGATCAVYYVAGGYWRLIPSVGSGGYRGSFSYITQDEYPTGDPFF